MLARARFESRGNFLGLEKKRRLEKETCEAMNPTIRFTRLIKVEAE